MSVRKGTSRYAITGPKLWTAKSDGCSPGSKSVPLAENANQSQLSVLLVLEGASDFGSAPASRQPAPPPAGWENLAAPLRARTLGRRASEPSKSSREETAPPHGAAADSLCGEILRLQKNSILQAPLVSLFVSPTRWGKDGPRVEGTKQT